jgi:hypothetical protein
MSNRSLIYLTSIVIAAMAFILLVNLVSLFSPAPKETYLAFNDVKGIAVEHKKIPYTLNFEQQNRLIEYLNLSTPSMDTKPPLQGATSLNFDRILIFRFNGPDIILTPLSFLDDNLIYLAPDWNLKGEMQDRSHGKLKSLIAQTYDP